MPEAALRRLGGEVAAGRLIPYLGPDLLTLGEAPPVVPAGARELAQCLTRRVAVPGRIAGNLWHAAQYIETFRHRVTLDRLMLEIFQPVPEPSPLHRWLAGLPRLPLIVDSWYDATMAEALAGRRDWGLIQGASKARRPDEAPWFRAYDGQGAACPEAAAAAWATLLYKPHGATRPAGDVLASDADYVEVLTDIDIQTPIPAAVKDRRGGRGFLFLGCRFYDQILRTFARSILKHSAGPHFAVVPPGELTRNEEKFFAVSGITPLPLPLARAAALLAAGSVS